MLRTKSGFSVIWLGIPVTLVGVADLDFLGFIRGS